MVDPDPTYTTRVNMTNPNDPILPQVMKEGGFSYGLTKREFFSAMALQGITAYHAAVLRIETSEQIAIRAIGLADALIAELNKEKS